MTALDAVEIIGVAVQFALVALDVAIATYAGLNRQWAAMGIATTAAVVCAIFTALTIRALR